MSEYEDCKNIMHTIHRTHLDRIDAITFEQHLKDTLGALLTFDTYSLLFPRHEKGARFLYESREQRLHLPLLDNEGRVLAVFVARGVDEAVAQQLEPLWSNLGSLLGQNLLYYKRSLCDPVTGLYARHYLINCLDRALQVFSQEAGLSVKVSSTPSDEKSAEKGSKKDGGSTKEVEGDGKGGVEGQDGNQDGSRGGKQGGKNKKNRALDKQITALERGSSLPGLAPFVGRGAIGIVVLRFSALKDVVKEYGYQFADNLMVALADAMTEQCPEQVIAARTGDFEFALAVPAATKTSCANLAGELVTALSGVCIEHPLRHEMVGTSVSAGFVLYPQDAAGSFALKPAQEQARLLLRKARLAAALANEQFLDWSGRQAVMGFGNILTEGGRILEVLPLSRVVVSLGSASHAREGQRFSVWTLSSGNLSAGGALPGGASSGGLSTGEFSGRPAPLYKGEIALMDVHENHAHAEVLHLGDPSWDIQAGDRLVLLPEEQGASRQEVQGESALRRDPLTGLLRYGDFLAQWTAQREDAKGFVLSLVRLDPSQEGEANPMDSSVSSVADRVREMFGKEHFGGRYGLNSLIVYHPEGDVAALEGHYATLAQEIEERFSIKVAVGLAPYPYLNFRKSDILENCRKALEYAQLLPSPHIGVFDSLALNISADKRFSQGDTFGAIKEYKTALLADDENTLAWNSLGVSLATLGKHTEAEECFQKALTVDAHDIMAHYNLGTVYQMTGQSEAAEQSFFACLEQDEGYLFALLRLGQLAEQKGDMVKARSLYSQASGLPSGKGMTHRLFARIALAEGKGPEAREHLHAALVHDPQDALALQLMAGIYLDAGEDPDMAASLARQAVSLRPDLRTGWLELARALEIMNHHDEARQARLRAGAL